MVKSNRNNNNNRSNNKSLVRSQQRYSKYNNRVPPQITTSFKATHTFRYTNPAIALSNQALTCANFLRMLCSYTTVGNAIPILHGLKLKHIEMWVANSPAGGAPVEIELQYRTNNADFGGESKIYTDMAMGATDVAHIFAKPAKGSFSASWLPYASTDEVVRITCPTHTVIDFTFECVLLDGESATTFAAAGSATPTIGGYTLSTLSPVGLTSFA